MLISLKKIFLNQNLQSHFEKKKINTLQNYLSKKHARINIIYARFTSLYKYLYIFD